MIIGVGGATIESTDGDGTAAVFTGVLVEAVGVAGRCSSLFSVLLGAVDFQMLG